MDKYLWRSVLIIAKPHVPFTLIEGRLDAVLRKTSRIKGLRCLRLLIQTRLPDIHVHAFNSRVQQLLTEATNLDALAIQDGTISNQPSFFLLDRIHSLNFSLTQFEYHDSITPELWGFIASQPQIKRLVLSYLFGAPAPPDVWLPPDALHELEAVFAPASLLPFLVKNRPVKFISLHTFGATADLAMLWRAVSLSAQAIRGLSARVDSERTFRQLMIALPQYVPDLRYLSVCWGDSWHSEPYVGDCSSLLQLSKLECIRWRGNMADSPRLVRFELNRWHPFPYASPSLRVVQYEVSSEHRAVPNRAEANEGVWQRDGQSSTVWQSYPRRFISPALKLSNSILVRFLFSSSIHLH